MADEVGNGDSRLLLHFQEFLCDKASIWDVDLGLVPCVPNETDGVKAGNKIKASGERGDVLLVPSVRQTRNGRYLRPKRGDRSVSKRNDIACRGRSPHRLVPDKGVVGSGGVGICSSPPASLKTDGRVVCSRGVGVEGTSSSGGVAVSRGVEVKG